MFHWNGPEFEIRKRTGAEMDVLGEVEDFAISRRDLTEDDEDGGRVAGKKRKHSEMLGE